MIKTVAQIGDKSENLPLLISNVSNNISTPNVANKIQKPKNVFLFGSTKFYEKAIAVGEKVNYYISEVPSNEYGVFEYPYILDMQSRDFFIIYFDTLNNAHPKNVVVEFWSNDTSELVKEEKYEIKSPVFLIPNENKYRVKIRINDWNKPNSPLIVTGVTSYYDIENFISLELEGLDRTDATKPSWGIKTNSGNFKFIDEHHIIESLSKILLRKKITFQIQNVENRQNVSSLMFSNQNTDRKTNECKVELKDFLDLFQKINVKKYRMDDFQDDLPSTHEEFKTAYDILNRIANYDLLNARRSIPIFSSYTETGFLIDNATKNWLKSIKIKFPYLEEGSAWAQLTKLCELSGCHIFVNADGIICMHFGGGA